MESKFKGTPGKWECDEIGIDGILVYQSEGLQGHICQMANFGRFDSRMSNAQLIASAPDLLEALETIIGFNRKQAEDQYGDPEKAESWACVKVARKAIAKALNP